MQEHLKQIEAKADKALEYATKVLMAMPKLMAKIDGLEEKIKLLGESVGNISDGIDPLAADIYKEIAEIRNDIANRLIDRTATAESEKPKRAQTDYPTYVKVKDLSDKGYLDKEIATELGIPYTTVRAYLKWTDTQVAKKKQQWEAKSSSAPVEVYTMTEEERQAYIDTHVPTPKFYPDKEEQIELPIVYEEKLISSSPVVYREELLTVDDAIEYTHLINRTIPFNEWTAQDRDNNSFDSEYLPTSKDMIVIIRREDAYSMPYAVKELDWSAGANHPIDGWRLANEQEQGQYIQRAVGLM